MKIMEDTLSVIIPAYNEERSMRRILEKVCAVNLPLKKEIIIIDDGSTDRTGKICTDFTPPHRILLYIND